MDPLRHFSDGEGVRGPTQRCISQGGDPAGLELGAGWVEVALARRQTMGRPYLDEINTLTAIVGKVWAKSKGAIPVRGPSVTVVRVGEGKAELARRVNRVGGEVV